MRNFIIGFAAVIAFTAAGFSAAGISTAHAQANEGPPHFDRDLALAAYATGWEGAYLGGGLGGRARWEPLDWGGVELFSEHLIVETPRGSRHDHPVGFNLYVPIRLAYNLRFRPIVGGCAVFSFVDPDVEGAARADDILFGLHAGVGIEWAPLTSWSVFVDAQAIGYLGHDRTAQDWNGSVSEELGLLGVVQVAAGVQLHIDG